MRSEPHEFNIALALPLQAAAGLDAVQVAVEINLQHDGGVVRRTTCCRWDGSFKAQRDHVQLAHEGVHDPNRVVIGYEIVQALRKQSDTWLLS